MPKAKIVIYLAALVTLVLIPTALSNAAFASTSGSATYNFSYLVQSGDTLSAIGSKFDVAWQNIALANNIVSPYIISVGEVISIPLSSPTVSYVVQSGDTLISISAKYEINWQSIATENGILSPYIIYQGETLTIPLFTVVTYFVQSGDTLYSIGQKFGVSWELIASANGIQAPYTIFVGEELLIPSQIGASASQLPIARQSWVWLWNNYASGLAAISENPGAITVVSPNTYTLSDSGTFQVASTKAEICPQAYSLGLKCDPLIQNDQTNPAGINALLTSSSLQSAFIQEAVATAKSSNLDGYNVDFEPSSGVLNLASQYGVFLTNFANAMHAAGMKLSVDVATWDGGALWNYGIIGATPVDLVITMGTYDSSYTVFSQQLNLMLSSIPVSKVGVGLLTVSDDSTLSQRLQAIEAAGVPAVAVWPSVGGFLTAPYWSGLEEFIQN